MKKFIIILHCLALVFFGDFGHAVIRAQEPPPEYQTGCGNSDDDDNSDESCSGCDCDTDDDSSDDADASQGDDADDCDDTGANPVNPYKANVHRNVTDITTFGPAPIAFSRQANSRNPTKTGFSALYWELGTRVIWQHNWNYQMINEGSVANQYILLRYPNGDEYDFKPLTYPVVVGSQLVPPAYNGDRVYVTIVSSQGKIWGCTLHTRKGEELDFARSDGTNFHLVQKRDGLGHYWNLTYDSSSSTGRVTKVTNNFGRWIQIDHETGPNGDARIKQVSTSDGRVVTYGYSAGPTAGSDVLTSVNYPGGEQAVYTYTTSNTSPSPAPRPLLSTAIDPAYRHDKPGAQIKYVYNSAASYSDSHGFVQGTLLEERNAVTDQLIVQLPLGSGAYPKVLQGDGTEITRKFALGRLTTKGDGEGRMITYGRDNSGYGFVNSKMEPNGAQTQYTRDYAGRVLSRTGALGNTRSQAYNSKGFMVSKTDELNNTISWTRDSNNRRTRKDYPDGSFETWTNYNANSQPLNHRLRNGGGESFVYDSLGNMTSHTDALGNVTTFAYFPTGLPISMTDARLHTTSYTYSWRGQPLTLTHPDNTVITYVYDTFGNKISVTDELNHTTSWVYDEFNRVKTITDPLNHTTTYEYGRAPGCTTCSYVGTIDRITLPSGRVTTFSYDDSGLRTCQTIGAGTQDAATTTYGYDPGKNLTTLVTPNGKTWTYNYDGNHRKVAAIDPLGNATQWGYDDHGNKTSETRADGGVTNYVYDARNRLIQVTDPASNVTKMTYDNSDNLLTQQDAKSNVYIYSYDLLNRISSLVYPDSSVESYTYDAVGSRATYTTRGGQDETFSYDSRNREISSVWDDNFTPEVDKTYDAVSRLTSATSSVSCLSYTYDSANRLTSETQQNLPDQGPESVLYSYDPDNNRTNLQYPTGAYDSFTYTARNQVQQIVSYDVQKSSQGHFVILDVPTASAIYTYDLDGNRVGRALMNGTNEVDSFDDADKTLSVDHRKASTSFARLDYIYNSVNNRTSRTESGGLATGFPDTYGYDPIDQVTNVKYSYNSQQSTQSRRVDYVHDPVGNRLSLNDDGAITTYTADNLNEYTSVGDDAPTYDGNGNLATQQDWVYVFDAQNRLVSAQNGDGTYIYGYDPVNRCVSRTYVPPPPQHGHGGAVVNMTTYYLYDAWNLIADIDQGDNFIYRYVHGAKPDELIARLNPSSTVYYHADALGSAVALTDDSGNAIERYAYDVFGEPTIKDGNGYVIGASGFANRFLFAGRELLDTGLYDYRNRIYSPDLGRFIQTDPIRFAAGDSNLYRYVKNDPVWATDPDGLKGCACHANDSKACSPWTCIGFACIRTCWGGPSSNPNDPSQPPLSPPESRRKGGLTITARVETASTCD